MKKYIVCRDRDPRFDMMKKRQAPRPSHTPPARGPAAQSPGAASGRQKQLEGAAVPNQLVHVLREAQSAEKLRRQLQQNLRGIFFVAAIATRGQLCRDAETMEAVHNHCPPPIWADIWLFIPLYFFKEEETFRIESTLGK